MMKAEPRARVIWDDDGDDDDDAAGVLRADQRGRSSASAAAKLGFLSSHQSSTAC